MGGGHVVRLGPAVQSVMWRVSATLLAALLLAAPSLPDVLVPKCCPIGETLIRKVCKPTNRTARDLIVYETNLEPVPSAKVEFEWKPLPCVNRRMLHTDEFWIFTDGSVYRGEEYGTTKDYCLENLISSDGNLTSYPIFCQTMERMVEDVGFIINTVGYLASIPFTLITILVYATIKDLASLHGNITICSLSAFLISCVLLSCTGLRIVPPRSQICPYAGYAIQFFFMATFFWLNVMCFDIYWAFSGLRNLTGSVKERERKKLILYSIYAWGFPLLILLVTLGIDYSPAVPNDSLWKPRVGVDKCFFRDDTATGIYFYLPMGMIIAINIILFSITAYRIRTLQKETKVLKREDSRKHASTNDKERQNIDNWCHENLQGCGVLHDTDILLSFRYDTSTTYWNEDLRDVDDDVFETQGDKIKLLQETGGMDTIITYFEQDFLFNSWFSLYLKLFVVMGINWVMELVSFLGGGPSYIWYIPDFTNTLQGVFIFIIFVWKKRVRRLIWAKLRSCCGKQTISTGSKSPWTDSTRHTSSSGLSQNNIKMQPLPNQPTSPIQTSPQNLESGKP